MLMGVSRRLLWTSNVRLRRRRKEKRLLRLVREGNRMQIDTSQVNKLSACFTRSDDMLRQMVIRR